MDGDTLVVGAPYKASGQGAAYVYTRTAGETWTQTAKLVASDGVGNDAFGYSVAIDGDVIVVGAPGDDGNARLALPLQPDRAATDPGRPPPDQ